MESIKSCNGKILHGFSVGDHMPLDYDTDKLFEFYNKNPKVKEYMDSHFSSEKANPNYLPTLQSLYDKHQQQKTPKAVPKTPIISENTRKYALAGIAAVAIAYVIL